MARDKITVQEPVLDAQHSVAVVVPTAKTVTVANGIEISNAFDEKDNTVYLVISNTANADKNVTIKAGNSYPNKMRGDKVIEVKTATTAIVTIEDESRFENKDGSVYVDFAAGFTGTIYAIGKHAGIYLPQ